MHATCKDGELNNALTWFSWYIHSYMKMDLEKDSVITLHKIRP